MILLVIIFLRFVCKNDDDASVKKECTNIFATESTCPCTKLIYANDMCHIVD